MLHTRSLLTMPGGIPMRGNRVSSAHALHGVPYSMNSGVNFAGTANTMYAWPTFNPVAFTSDQFFVYNGATVSGNFKAAMYDFRTLSLLASVGATAQAGAQTYQLVSSAIYVPAGPVIVAIVFDNATATLLAINSVGTHTGDWASSGMGLMQQASAYASLPDPLSPVALASHDTNQRARIPEFGWMKEL